MDSTAKSVVEAAFEDAKAIFESDSAHDPGLLNLTQSKNNFIEVQTVVQKVKDQYESDRKDSKVRKWLDRLAQRLHFYGGILDVIAQHHPEYVALAWGSIKFLLAAAINHEKIVRTLAKAIALFAEALPNVDLQSSLYPTEQMKKAVTKLYVSIFQFFARARRWYQGNGFQRFIHSITHPVELEYNDLLDDVAECSRTIERISYNGAQAETRDMHRIVQTMHEEHRKTQLVVENMMSAVERIHATTSLTSLTCIDTNGILSDMQLGQIMEKMSNGPIVDPMQSFQYHCALRRQRTRSAAIHTLPPSFWKSLKLRSWSSKQESALVIIAGNFQARFMMRDFCVDIIQQLHDANVSVLLALKAPREIETHKPQENFSTIDIMKYLVRQAIAARRTAQTEKSMSLRYATFHEPDTEAKWFQIFEAVLADLGCLVYIVIDVEVLAKHVQPDDGFLWVQQFQALFANFQTRGLATMVKVVLVSCSPLPFVLSVSDRTRSVIPARAEVVTARQKKAGRAKQLPHMTPKLKILPQSPGRRGPTN